MIYDFDDIYEKACEAGYVEHGSTIPQSFLEEVFKMEYKQGDLAWIGPLIQLKNKIEENNHFCKTHQFADESSIELLPVAKFAQRVKKTREKYLEENKRTISTLLHADISTLSPAEQMKFRHQQDIQNFDYMNMNGGLKRILQELD